MKKELNVDDLQLAEVRTFDSYRNASEIPSVHGYTFLIKKDNHYENLFYPSLEFSVFERVPYSNTTRDGEDYGSKILLVQGSIEDGPCYIIQSSLSKIIDKETISTDELKQYILYSDMFFVDRVMFFVEHKLSIFEWFKYDRKLIHDMFLKDEFSDYFESYKKKVLKK